MKRLKHYLIWLGASFVVLCLADHFINDGALPSLRFLGLMLSGWLWGSLLDIASERNSG